MRRDLYPGIDLILHGGPGDFEYDLAVHPGADLRMIRLRFSGAEHLAVDSAGNIVAAVATGSVVQKKPVLYEVLPDGEHETVEGSWRLAGHGRAVFQVGHRDASRPTSRPWCNCKEPRQARRP